VRWYSAALSSGAADFKNRSIVSSSAGTGNLEPKHAHARSTTTKLPPASEGSPQRETPKQSIAHAL
jgi:hypothetical protein